MFIKPHSQFILALILILSSGPNAIGLRVQDIDLSKRGYESIQICELTSFIAMLNSNYSIWYVGTVSGWHLFRWIMYFDQNEGFGGAFGVLRISVIDVEIKVDMIIELEEKSKICASEGRSVIGFEKESTTLMLGKRQSEIQFKIVSDDFLIDTKENM